MLHTILDNIELNDKPIVKILFRNKDTRVVVVGLKKGIKMIDHQLPAQARLIMMKGSIHIDSKIEEVDLNEFDEYIIPPKVIHQVYAEEDAMIFIILDF